MSEIVISKPKAALWSKIGPRATFGMGMLDIAKFNDNLKVLTADTSTSAGLARFKAAHPDKYLDCGIAEQNMMGIAAGLASEGFDVVTTTFAPFQTMRCCEHIKVNLGYMQQKVCMVGLASGVVLGPLGYTHCCIEDISIMRSLPNVTVLSPADCTETIKAVDAALKHDGSVYIRLTGGPGTSVVYSEDYEFQIGRAIKLKEGHDVAVVATGSMVSKALSAATLLEQQNISVSVYDMHTIKPIDKKAVTEACESSSLLVTIEEHNTIGGLGSAVAEVAMTLDRKPRQLMLGLPDRYGKPKPYDQILEESGLKGALIADTILKSLDKT